jgi:hypothetical protein
VIAEGGLGAGSFGGGSWPPNADRIHATKPKNPIPRSTLYIDSQSPACVLTDLDIPVGRPVLIVVGRAAGEPIEGVEDNEELLMERVVAPMCRNLGAVVISGGTQAGVMAFLGRAMAEHAPECVLVGVAPDRKLIGFGARETDSDAARPEPNSRLVRTSGEEWGSEGHVLVRLAERIAEGNRIVMLAVGGGEGTGREVALATRRGWPVLLITGLEGESQRIADTLALPKQLLKSRRASTATAQQVVNRPKTSAGEPSQTLAVDIGERQGIERALWWRLFDGAVLKEAWQRFAEMDESAVRSKRSTTALAWFVLALATVTALLAFALVLSTRAPAYLSFLDHEAVRNWLKSFVTGLPLIAGILLGWMDRRSRTGTWIEIRASAESILREIYRFRARVKPYESVAKQGTKDANRRFHKVLAQIDFAMAERSAGRLHAAGSESWPPASLESRIPLMDNLVGPLSADVYDEARVCDQLNEFDGKARKTERSATLQSTAIFGLAAISAFFLSLSWRWAPLGAWAAVATTLLAACVSWREYRHWDARADAYRSTAVGLRSARGRWHARQKDGRISSDELVRYVREVEDALASEGFSWQRTLRQAEGAFVNRHRGR